VLLPLVHRGWMNLILYLFRKAQFVAIGVKQMKVSLAPFGIMRSCFGIQALGDRSRIHGVHV
jgi:hypothetical protein